MARSREPVLWALFSAGGMLAAMVLPALAAVFWFAVPLGWLDAPAREALLALAVHPLARLFVFAVAMLGLYHWAHRFRYTLYDGLQLYHLNQLIAVVTYGVATILTLLVAYTLFVWL